MLIYQIYELPGKISERNNQKIDTITVTKVITEKLQNTGGFIYLQGYITDSSIKFSENYDYRIDYPSEIYDGYITYVKSNGGGEYFMWSKNKISNLQKNLEIKGWFMTDNLHNLQHGKEYLQILYPIVEKRINEFN